MSPEGLDWHQVVKAIHTTAVGFDSFKKAPDPGAPAPQGVIIYDPIEAVKRIGGISQKERDAFWFCAGAPP
jgi:hypothetical protein